MANVIVLPKVGEQTNHEFRIVGAIVDGDVGKPVKLNAAADLTVELCADGDAIFGFIQSVEVDTDDGNIVVGVCTKGRVRATASGSVTRGEVVEAGANTAAGTDIVKWGIVSTHTVDDTTTTTVVSSTFPKNWYALTSAGDGEDLTLETV